MSVIINEFDSNEVTRWKLLPGCKCLSVFFLCPDKTLALLVTFISTCISDYICNKAFENLGVTHTFLNVTLNICLLLDFFKFYFYFFIFMAC